MAQKTKFKAEKQTISEAEIFNQILEENVKNPDMLQPFMVTEADNPDEAAEITSDVVDILSPSQIERVSLLIIKHIVSPYSFYLYYAQAIFCILFKC